MWCRSSDPSLSSKMKDIDMAGHQPFPPDSRQGAFDYDEDTAMIARRHKHGYHFRSKEDRRKPYTIECRLIPLSKNSLIVTFGLDRWFVHGRYDSGTARDLAFVLLTVKAEHEMKGWGSMEWRKVG